jgi:DNA-binding NarL/FixJ family response regulator
MARILIVDDSDHIRRTLRTLISEVADWTVCGETENGVEAVTLARQLNPDVVVLDLSMPVLDGLRAAPEIMKVSPKTSIVLYTMHYTAELEKHARLVGVQHVLSKMGDGIALVDCIQELLRGPQIGTNSLASVPPVPSEPMNAPRSRKQKSPSDKEKNV